MCRVKTRRKLYAGKGITGPLQRKYDLKEQGEGKRGGPEGRPDRHT